MGDEAKELHPQGIQHTNIGRAFWEMRGDWIKMQN